MTSTPSVGPGTPLPWEADGAEICQVRDGGANLLVIGTMTAGFHDMEQASRDAAFTVKAANCHDDLVEALAGLVLILDAIAETDGLNPPEWQSLEDARTALARARSELAQ